MERNRISLIALLFALAGWLPASAQQRHVADQEILDDAIAGHVRERADDREAIRRVLAMEQVRALATGLGLDLTRAERAVATLDDADVAVLAAHARSASDALAGGQSTVTISTTAIIIGLLVLILLIVAL